MESYMKAILTIQTALQKDEEHSAVVENIMESIQSNLLSGISTQALKILSESLLETLKIKEQIIFGCTAANELPSMQKAFHILNQDQTSCEASSDDISTMFLHVLTEKSQAKKQLTLVESDSLEKQQVLLHKTHPDICNVVGTYYIPV
jgi:hypothetical protein